MTPSPQGLARLFPAAALIAALGMPMTACAQAQAVEEKPAEAPAVAQADEKPEVAEAEKPEEEAEPEKTAEELAMEADEKERASARGEDAFGASGYAVDAEEKQRIEAELSLLRTKQQEAHAEAQREKTRRTSSWNCAGRSEPRDEDAIGDEPDADEDAD